MDCSATELPLPLENGASERCITTTVQVDRAVQVSSLFSVSAMDKRKWRRKERDSNARIERLKSTVDKYKQELQKLKEECYVSAFLQVVEKAKEKGLAASILVEQVQNFAKKKPTWSEVTVRHAVVLRNLSTRAYGHVRSTVAMKLLQEQAGHTCDASFAGVGPPVQFMDTVHRWFVLMDVSNCTQHIHQKNADCKQFASAGDERLIWLETSFLDYLADLKRSQQDENIAPHCLPFIPSPLYIMNKHQWNLRIYFTAPSLIRAQVSLHKHARNGVVASSALGLGMGLQRGVVASA
ncbi:hypothetical protein HPB49_026166 [Dermacentor silvarum]|nr:hypothetical protein HPB49_026166 [Dermacentor silvarum]